MFTVKQKSDSRFIVTEEVTTTSEQPLQFKVKTLLARTLKKNQEDEYDSIYCIDFTLVQGDSMHFHQIFEEIKTKLIEDNVSNIIIE